MRSLFGIVVALAFTGTIVPITTEAVESNRHQVTKMDLPRIPPTEPMDALKTFQLTKGCHLELVAAEPMVADPVDACFDDFGRLYVAEMHGYPFSQEPTQLNPAGGGKKDAGIIRLLEDTDDDGRMDRSVVFADKISWPTSVCCYKGGLFVLAPQYLYYLKDTDGDHQADLRRIILSGFGRENVQSLANNMKWGLDQRIYFAAGRNPKRLLHHNQPLFPLHGSDLRFDPKTETFDAVTGGQQFGLSMDDWGNRFVCHNSDHIQQVVHSRAQLARNPFLAGTRAIASIASDGASARVFRSSPPEPWRIIRQQWRAAAKGYKLVVNSDGGWEFLPLDPSKKKGVVPTEYPVGYFTSATGITIYRGDAYPEEFHGNIFVGDVGGNLVHRKEIKDKNSQGVVFKADRTDEDEEFIRSTDNWFRPVNFVNAPDGTIYVLDMYRETVEHPYSIPDEIKQFLHLQSGNNRGRIYRIVTPNMQRKKTVRIGDLSSDQLVQQFESGNSWNRETAQRLLWERQDIRALPGLARLVASSKNPLARVHALHALAGLQSLTVQQIERALTDSHSRVREQALPLARPFWNRSLSLPKHLLNLCGDSDARVRFQAAYSLGDIEQHEGLVLEGMLKLARDPKNGIDTRTALLSSVTGHAGSLAIRLLEDAMFLVQDHSVPFLSELCLIIGTDPDIEQTQQLLATVVALKDSSRIQYSTLLALGEGMRRRGASIADLQVAETTPPGLRTQIHSLFQRAVRTAKNEQQTMAKRTSAIGLLAFTNRDMAMEHLSEFLSPRMPQSLQRSAIAALAQHNGNQVAQILIQYWKRYSPLVRRDVVDALLTHVDRIEILLAALEAKQLSRGDLDVDKTQLLLKHPNPRIRERSKNLFGNIVHADRVKVVSDFQSVNNLEGNPQKGLELFKKKCATCHRVGSTGHQVAPDLVSAKNKSVADLLIAILDPNREAQPNYNTYTVLTDKGRIFTGIIAEESANSITLRREEAKEDVILRSHIESLVSNGVSLMPEGLEKDLTAQDLADVISYVQSIPLEKQKPH